MGIAPIAAGAEADVPLDILPLAALLMKEILVGLAFAFALGALFAAVSAGGSLIDTLIGFSYGSLIDPLTGHAVDGHRPALRPDGDRDLHRDRRRRVGDPGPGPDL